MNSFLITFKPDTENAERGWPVAELERLARRVASGKRTEESWRFSSYRSAKLGDRVFLLQQGTSGPVILGCGWIAESPALVDGRGLALIEFDALVPSTSRALVSKAMLKAIPNSATLWNTQASGIQLPPAIATELERFVGEALVVRDLGTSSDTSSDHDAINDLGSDVPDRARVLIWTYARDLKVRAEVLRRAGGECELCGQVGFIKSDGTRYLECHHIIALANDGEDRVTNVIALCPNDHRAAHFGRDAEKLELQMIARLLSLRK